MKTILTAVLASLVLFPSCSTMSSKSKCSSGCHTCKHGHKKHGRKHKHKRHKKRGGMKTERTGTESGAGASSGGR